MRDGAVNHLYQGLATLMRRRAELSAEVHPGLSLTAYTVLTQIQAAPGPRACDLADLFGLDKSTVSRQINELQAAGLIGREGERPGRRGYTLVLTAEGQRKLEQEAERARQRLAEGLASWKERDITAFAGMIERFLTDLGWHAVSGRRSAPYGRPDCHRADGRRRRSLGRRRRTWRRQRPFRATRRRRINHPGSSFRGNQPDDDHARRTDRRDGPPPSRRPNPLRATPARLPTRTASDRHRPQGTVVLSTTPTIRNPKGRRRMGTRTGGRDTGSYRLRVVGDPWTYPVAFVAALIIATVTSPAGVSGAVLLLPFQVSVLGTPSPAVTPTNLLYNVVATPGALYRYWRQGQTGGVLTRQLLLGTLPGVIAGSVIRVELLPGPQAADAIIAVVLIPLGTYLIVRRTAANPSGAAALLPLVPIAAIVGCVGGVYGIGGGSILAPILIGAGQSPYRRRPCHSRLHPGHLRSWRRHLRCAGRAPRRFGRPRLGDRRRPRRRWSHRRVLRSTHPTPTTRGDDPTVARGHRGRHRRAVRLPRRAGLTTAERRGRPAKRGATRLALRGGWGVLALAGSLRLDHAGAQSEEDDP